MTHSSCNFLFGDGSVRTLQQPRPVTAQALSLALRQVGWQAQATTFGAQGPALQASLAMLRRGGLSVGVPSAGPATAGPPVLMVSVQPAAMGAPGAAVLFLAAEDQGPIAISLLLPAVQRERAAGRLDTRGGDVALVLVQGPRAGQSMPPDSFALNFTKIRFD